MPPRTRRTVTLSPRDRIDQVIGHASAGGTWQIMRLTDPYWLDDNSTGTMRGLRRGLDTALKQEHANNIRRPVEQIFADNELSQADSRDYNRLRTAVRAAEHAARFR